jgi:hypothetical protein
MSLYLNPPTLQVLRAVDTLTRERRQPVTALELGHHVEMEPGDVVLYLVALIGSRLVEEMPRATGSHAHPSSTEPAPDAPVRLTAAGHARLTWSRSAAE